MNNSTLLMSSSWLEIPQLGGYLNLIWIISYHNTDYLCLKSHWKKQYYTEDENKNKEKECVEKRPPPPPPSSFSFLKWGGGYKISKKLGKGWGCWFLKKSLENPKSEGRNSKIVGGLITFFPFHIHILSYHSN